MATEGEKIISKMIERIQTSKYGRHVVAAIVCGAALWFAGNFVYALIPKSYSFSISGGEIFSNRHFLAKVLQEEAAASRITLKIIPTHSSEAALDKLNDHSLDIALIQGGIADAWPNVEHIATLPPEVIHFMVQPGIKNIDDLAGKRICLGRANDGVRIVAKQVLSFAGLEEGINYTEVNYDSEALMNLRPEQMPDAVVVVSFAPAYVAEYLVKSHEYRMIELPFARALGQRYDWVAESQIPAYTYGVRPPVPAADVRTLGLNLSLLANRHVDPEGVEKLMEVLYSPKVQGRLRMHFEEKDVTKPSGFPMSKATNLFMHRNDSVLSPKLFDTLKNALGLLISLVSAMMFLKRFFKNETVRTDDKEFKQRLQELAVIEAAVRSLDNRLDATLAEISDQGERLSALKEKILTDFPVSTLADPSILDKLLAGIADTRRFQQEVLDRIETRRQKPG